MAFFSVAPPAIDGSLRLGLRRVAGYSLCVVVGAGVLGRGDGASVSSLGSSCSPPPGPEDLADEFKRRARRREHAPSPLNARRRIQSGVCCVSAEVESEV